MIQQREKKKSSITTPKYDNLKLVKKPENHVDVKKAIEIYDSMPEVYS